MNSNYLLLCFAAICFYLGCSQFNKSQLVGKWTAVKVLETGNPMKLEPNEVTFVFQQNDRYSYTGTIGYQEAGVFSLEGDLLLSKDTTRSASKEKAVKIVNLEKDSLTLEMQSNQGKEQVIYLVKN